MVEKNTKQSGFPEGLALFPKRTYLPVLDLLDLFVTNGKEGLQDGHNPGGEVCKTNLVDLDGISRNSTSNHCFLKVTKLLALRSPSFQRISPQISRY